MPRLKTSNKTKALDAAEARFYRDYGRRFRRVRLALKITKSEAAATFGVTLKTYRRWEAGHRQRGVKSYQGLVAFSRRYHVKLGWLISGEGVCFGPRLVTKNGMAVQS
jgi:transcriptional regulator with XRE-family HTH domain